MRQPVIANILFLSLIVYSTHATAKIVQIPEIEDIHSILKQTVETTDLKQTLMAFDIDMTLTQPDHPAGQYANLKKYKSIYDEILNSVSPEQKDCMLTLITQTVPQKLVDPHWPALVQTLNEKGIKTIAFTTSLAGQFGSFNKKMVFLRRDQLLSQGLDFSKSLRSFGFVVPFLDFPEHAHYYPIFYHGVLSSNGTLISKGTVFIALLDHLSRLYEMKAAPRKGFHPKVVILVDDRMKNLKSMASALKAYNPNIQFIGLHYQKAYRNAPETLISEKAFKRFWQDLADQAKVIFPVEKLS